MTATIINGKEIARQIGEELKIEVEVLRVTRGIVPGLATIIVGCDGPSLVYVANKVAMCQKLNMHSERYDLPAHTSEAKLLELISQLNTSPHIHGVLVQLPLPRHISETQVLMAIDPMKDVDGTHPINVGKMIIGESDFLPCTPAGIQELLIRSQVETDGADVVVVGRSNTVGKPMAQLLLQANATVTICHTGTKDMAAITKQADILIAAVGVPEMVKGDMLKPGCVVIDVGVNRIDNPDKSSDKKTKLVGDAHFDSCKDVASKITPVPGGVGPMTITMLMANTLKAAKLRIKK